MDHSTHGSLVSSSDVTGTEVYGSDGSHIGSIDHLMIDKLSGKVAYAVMRFGGFLGLGEEHRPVPWGKLRYDTRRHGLCDRHHRTAGQGRPRAPGQLAWRPRLGKARP